MRDERREEGDDAGDGSCWEEAGKQGSRGEENAQPRGRKREGLNTNSPRSPPAKSAAARTASVIHPKRREGRSPDSFVIDMARYSLRLVPVS